MKRLISVLITFILVATSVTAIAESSVMENHIYESVYLGEPITREDILQCAYDEINGKTIMYTTLASRPTATFIAYNLTDRKLEYSTPLQVGSNYYTKTSWSHKIGDDGCVYLIPHGYISLFKYDPYKKEMTNSGTPIDGLHAAYGVCFDDEGNIYFGGYPLASAYKFNKNLEMVKDYGTIFPGESYVMSMAEHNGKLYAGGQDVSTSFRSIDTKTGKIEVIESPTEKYGINEKVSSYYMMDQIDNLLFCTVKLESGRYSLFVFDAEKEEWVFHYRRAYGHYMSPVKDGLTYFIGAADPYGTTTADVGLLSLDLETFEVKDTGIRYYGNLVGSAWMEMTGNKDLPGESLVFFSRTHNKMYAMNLETKKAVPLDYKLPAVGVMIQDLENGAGNTILMGSYMGDELISYNPTTGEKTRYASTQTETIKKHGNLAYAGCYTQGVLYEYDLTKPPSTNNPLILTNMSAYHQERIYDICIIDDNLIAMGTFPNKGYSDGGIAIYDKTTKKTVFYDIAPGQSVEGLAYKDGILYGCTSIYVNAQPIPTDESVVFAFDLKTRKVIKKAYVRPDGIGEKLTAMGDIEIGPDGNLWGTSGGIVFCLDTDNLELIKYAQSDKIFPRRTMSKNAAMYWDENGYLYTVCNGWFTIVEPDTMKVRNTKRSMQYFIIGEDGNIYYSHFSTEGSNLSKFTISALTTEKVRNVEAATREGIILKTDNGYAIVNGKPEMINSSDNSISAKYIDGTLMVPLRFVSESLGATVAWSAMTNTAVVRLGKIALKATIGDSKVCVNGKKTEMGTPIVLNNGNTYISLDTLCMALNKKVFKNDAGLIVITPEEKTFYADDELLEDISIYMEHDLPKLLSGNFINKFI